MSEGNTMQEKGARPRVLDVGRAAGARRILAQSLTARHIGREFVCWGRLLSFTADADGFDFVFEDGQRAHTCCDDTVLWYWPEPDVDEREGTCDGRA